MEQPLFRLLYCSRNRTENGAGFPVNALGEIFQTARLNNGRRDITGALLYNSGYFAQVLEGPKAALERVFEAIQRDPRHDDVTLLESSSIVCRDFSHWSMARVEPVSEVQAHVTGLALQQAMRDPSEAGRGVLELLRSLVVRDD